MITLDSELHIQRPAREVFDFIVNVENAPKWQPAVIETARVTPGPIRVGTQFREVAKLMGRRVQTVCEITALEANRRFAFKATSSGPFTYDTEYRLEATRNGTRLNIRGHFHLKGLWRFLEPFVRSEVRRESAQELRAMQAAIEAA